ncbi:hypothetical protein Q75_03965 [Bacillus coahuilensis p1.1.43]|uniref:YheE n=1 Tax=Bacillus coahuilensis p1.1.43 TaxID=1150625 RepID=A0A147KAX1_9BACI|nr:YheE family protein [Bacillus coahuilensis]KUP07922.1 hypothetical protein Q75_03965 [Bacillus coahuilensis p1.1.43]
MIQHFQFKSMFKNSSIPGWTFSFYYNQQKYTGDYLKDGSIHWEAPLPSQEEEGQLKKQIHELMLFHVYD